ncbi:MAG TPA: hypothetical protein PLI28_03190 [Petrotogaceae bacterium]|nr:hypothetical protein [Petrotogaceae bacterium]HOG33561.1 hypothetical protein [Petrotogaceae bacterium]HPG48511.1 hypothetical protein [Petrotogaceae bacterium]HPO27770.1 hypothetical protein [Petrotogaceae bacterium]HPX15356.1 hypothetical protein [Petrotogaceae bacterium]
MLSSSSIQVILASLNIMWEGMLGILVFMLLIYLVIILLGKIFPTQKKSQ